MFISFLKSFLFLAPFSWISLAPTARPAGLKLASSCYLGASLLMSYIWKIYIVQTNFYWIHQTHKKTQNYFCYKSVLPVSIREELGMPARSTSLPPPSSRVSAGTEAEVAGGTGASHSPGGTRHPRAGCPCARGGCASRAKEAALPQQHRRRRRQPARRVGPLTRATGQRYCRDNPGQDPPRPGDQGWSFWDPRRQLRWAGSWLSTMLGEKHRHTLLMLEIRLVCLWG